MDGPGVEPGISWELAQDRVKSIGHVVYQLRFRIPDSLHQPVAGSMRLDFSLSRPFHALQLDFRESADHLLSIHAGDDPVDYSFEQGHIIIPKKYLKSGANTLYIDFIAGDLSLNRSEDYLYTLFVPDRASTAFPCFDQPDLKARFCLELDIPSGWVAVANGGAEVKEEKEDRTFYIFEETQPISTYLFAFAAGRFQMETQQRNGRPMTMYFRETDLEKVRRNADTIFDLHASALSWLEEYTAIPFPFEKFDFVLIPGFQYGGMEHVGCIFYREPSLLLDPTATDNQKLGRARLIAHETAHMWFGDLVTMKWFNDVWLKEVFANFMAAKIANPNFPEINHQLSFLLAHQPTAYSEDRSEGSHPIQQQLENLKDAGSMYGGIIYQKAPVVMRQLERLTGEEVFREGLREYLQGFSFSNATWDDLIGILDSKTETDLASWSRIWVKEAGMPVLRTEWSAKNGQIHSLMVFQERKSGSGAYWPQYTEAVLLYPDSIKKLPLLIQGETTEVLGASGQTVPEALLLNGSEMSYGYFKLEDVSRDLLLERLPGISDPLIRGAGWMALYEECLQGRIVPSRLMEGVLNALPTEQEPLNRQNLLGYLNTLYWRFFRPEQRQAIAPQVEDMLWQLSQSATDLGAKAAFFRTYKSVALTPEAIDRLYQYWKSDKPAAGIPLSEQDRIDLAADLALRLPEQADSILFVQLEAVQNPDRKQYLTFIRPALSGDPLERDRFFESLKQAENRHYEPWVVDALEYLHHPLRAAESEKYIRPSLELMEEIQATGDIFFPRQWITATLSGHQSPSAAATVRRFLEDHPDYPYRLRNKILMAADLLFRAAGTEDREEVGS